MRQPKRILLADADECFCKLLTDALEKTGHFLVTWVGDGREVLEKILLSPPDILIAEVVLPGLDGLRLLRTLQERHVSIPQVLVISSFVNQSTAAEAAVLGASYFLPKPFTAQFLTERLI